MPETRIPVAILGATGTVGQKLVRRLADHPWFRVAAVVASDGNAGRPYREAVRWRESTPLPAAVAELQLGRADRPLETTLAFSALDTTTAERVEPIWAANGTVVVTNASPARLDPHVPLVIPEVNADHLELVGRQRHERRWPGAIVANPNCTATGLAMALAPLHRAFGIERVVVSTMQAISGAGWPGVPSLDILGNVIPYIAEEEEKIDRETRKLLGTLDGGTVLEAPIALSAHCNRVPVIDGHLATVSVGFSRAVAPDEVTATLASWRPTGALGLPSAPECAIAVMAEPDRPQPRLDAERGDGMTAALGRVRTCPVLGIRFVVLSHNTVRGAAGAAILNAELLVREGWIRR